MSKKRICFITLSNLYLCPYISKYISLIDCDYDIIYWDRHGIDENMGAKEVFPFRYEMDENQGKLKKISGYLKFRKYAIDIIKKKNYDGVILLQTSVGILLQKILTKKFSGKYIVDVRDYTMEKNKIFFSLVKNLINKSANTVISSKGYKSFLPEYEYTIVHNDIKIDKDTIVRFEKRKRNKERVVISYIGLIRFNDQNKRIILKFKDDDRFLLRFIGKGANSLKKFCLDNNITNVELIDRFPPEKTLEYYYDTDIIYNLYGNNSPLLDYALSNKLYYAAKLRMPIIVCPDTYMEEVCTQFGFGFVFKLQDMNACTDLFNYYQSINWSIFEQKCQRFIRLVEEENEVFNDMVKKYINKL
jgi:hypothetical protein